MHLQTILLPVDSSEPSQAAARFAAQLAHDHGALLVIFHAVETLGAENVTYGEAASSPQPETHRKRLFEELHRLVPRLADVRVRYVLGEDPPAEAIVKLAAEADCDLIVLGSHGRTGLQRLLAGSVAEDVVRKAPCPVLVVKAGMVPRPPHPPAPARLDPSFLTEPAADS
jgi:universal stress protein A